MQIIVKLKKSLKIIALVYRLPAALQSFFFQFFTSGLKSSINFSKRLKSNIVDGYYDASRKTSIGRFLVEISRLAYHIVTDNGASFCESKCAAYNPPRVDGRARIRVANKKKWTTRGKRGEFRIAATLLKELINLRVRKTRI